MELRAFRVYGKDGHRQRATWFDSTTFMTTRGCLVSVLNGDMTGQHDYTSISICGESDAVIMEELEGQISDGLFENCSVGKVEEIDLSRK